MSAEKTIRLLLNQLELQHQALARQCHGEMLRVKDRYRGVREPLMHLESEWEQKRLWNKFRAAAGPIEREIDSLKAALARAQPKPPQTLVLQPDGSYAVDPRS